MHVYTHLQGTCIYFYAAAATPYASDQSYHPCYRLTKDSHGLLSTTAPHSHLSTSIDTLCECPCGRATSLTRNKRLPSPRLQGAPSRPFLFHSLTLLSLAGGLDSPQAAKCEALPEEEDARDQAAKTRVWAAVPQAEGAPSPTTEKDAKTSHAHQAPSYTLAQTRVGISVGAHCAERSRLSTR